MVSMRVPEPVQLKQHYRQRSIRDNLKFQILLHDLHVQPGHQQENHLKTLVLVLHMYHCHRSLLRCLHHCP